MSDKAIHMLCVTAVIIATIIAVVVIALFYHGDVAALISGLVTIGLFAWSKIDMSKVSADNAKTNEAVVKVNASMAQKADSVLHEVSAKADSVTNAAAVVIDKADSVIESNK